MMGHVAAKEKKTSGSLRLYKGDLVEQWARRETPKAGSLSPYFKRAESK